MPCGLSASRTCRAVDKTSLLNECSKSGLSSQMSRTCARGTTRTCPNTAGTSGRNEIEAWLSAMTRAGAVPAMIAQNGQFLSAVGLPSGASVVLLPRFGLSMHRSYGRRAPTVRGSSGITVSDVIAGSKSSLGCPFHVQSGSRVSIGNQRSFSVPLRRWPMLHRDS
jgi:hypothetical protein